MAIRCRLPSRTFNIFSGNLGDLELSRPINDPRSNEKCPPPLPPSCCDRRFGVDDEAVDDDAIGCEATGTSFGKFALCSASTCRHLVY
jgi:hypothetical protein